MTSPSSRVAIIGDVGGHLEQLLTELARLGVEPEAPIPEGLVVIQVGDLVHRGPDSEGVVSLVNRYLRRQPEQWIQLVGNHEAQYLRDPAFEWPERIHYVAEDRLRLWWREGRMVAAAAVVTADRQYLVTHAGLTAGYWHDVLDSPTDAVLTAAALNSFIGSHEGVLFAAGEMLGGKGPDHRAGPVWAAAGTELSASWLASDAPMPFSQVHGHSAIVDWSDLTARADQATIELLRIEPDLAHEMLPVPGGQELIGIDPGHGRAAQERWRAFVIEDAVVRTRTNATRPD